MPMEMSILVASGDQDVADFLQRRLMTLGCQTAQAFRAPQALAVVESREIHAALVGEALEDGPGSDVVQELRRRHPELPIFFVTTAIDEASAQAASAGRQRHSFGATRCVRCPTSIEALEELLEEALEVAAAARDMVAASRGRPSGARRPDVASESPSVLGGPAGLR